MKINITNNSGILVEQITQVEEYDLSRPLAAADLIQQIREAMQSDDAEPNATRGDLVSA